MVFHTVPAATLFGYLSPVQVLRAIVIAAFSSGFFGSPGRCRSANQLAVAVSNAEM